MDTRNHTFHYWILCHNVYSSVWTRKEKMCPNTKSSPNWNHWNHDPNQKNPKTQQLDDPSFCSDDDHWWSHVFGVHLVDEMSTIPQELVPLPPWWSLGTIAQDWRPAQSFLCTPQAMLWTLLFPLPISGEKGSENLYDVLSQSIYYAPKNGKQTDIIGMMTIAIFSRGDHRSRRIFSPFQLLQKQSCLSSPLQFQFFLLLLTFVDHPLVLRCLPLFLVHLFRYSCLFQFLLSFPLFLDCVQFGYQFRRDLVLRTASLF